MLAKFLIGISLLYALLLVFSAIVALKNKKLPIIYGLSLIFAALGMAESAFTKQVWLLLILLLVISLLCWVNSFYLTEKRHLSHHIIRLIFHVLLFLAFIFLV